MKIVKGSKGICTECAMLIFEDVALIDKLRIYFSPSGEMLTYGSSLSEHHFGVENGKMTFTLCRHDNYASNRKEIKQFLSPKNHFKDETRS